jgi:hypothetical protein
MRNNLHKTILSLAALVCAFALLVHVVMPAHADMGPTVSYGANPVFSFGGIADGAETLITAPADQVVIVKDIIFSQAYYYYECNQQITLSTGSGQTLGVFKFGSYVAAGSTPSVIAHSFADGLVVAPGDSLVINGGASSCKAGYSVSGHYARP